MGGDSVTLDEMDNLQLGKLMEKVLKDFGEEILRYDPAPDEREEHLTTLGGMFRKALREEVRWTEAQVRERVRKELEKYQGQEANDELLEEIKGSIQEVLRELREAGAIEDPYPKFVVGTEETKGGIVFRLFYPEEMPLGKGG